MLGAGVLFWLFWFWHQVWKSSFGYVYLIWTALICPFSFLVCLFCLKLSSIEVPFKYITVFYQINLVLCCIPIPLVRWVAIHENNLNPIFIFVMSTTTTTTYGLHIIRNTGMSILLTDCSNHIFLVEFKLLLQMFSKYIPRSSPD